MSEYLAALQTFVSELELWSIVFGKLFSIVFPWIIGLMIMGVVIVGLGCLIVMTIDLVHEWWKNFEGWDW